MAFSPTALAGAGATRFGVKKNLQLVSLDTIADTTTYVPTQPEIDAGTDLTCAVQATSGFTATDTFTDLPDLCSDVTGKIWDGSSLADSSMTFYLDSTATGDAFDYFTTGDEKYILQCPWGLVDSARAVVWAMTIGSVLPLIAISGPSLVTVAMAPRAMTVVTLPVSV